MYEGTEREIVFQQSVFSRKGVDRILKYAFELARQRPQRHVTSATKSNGISITMPYWDERFRAMAAQLSRHPRRPVPHRHPDRALRPPPGALRRRRRLEPVRRHPVRPRARRLRHDRHRAVGQHQPGARAPVAVRAGARLGARHRRQGHRQPDRPDLVRRADARFPRAPGGGAPPSSRRSSAVLASPGAPKTPDLGGSRADRRARSGHRGADMIQFGFVRLQDAIRAAARAPSPREAAVKGDAECHC